MLSSDAVLERAADLKSRGIPFVLATVVRSEAPTSAKPGAKAIVDADGEISGWIGGGCAQPAVISTAKDALADGQARLIRVSPTKDTGAEAGVIDFGMTCHSGGSLDIFLEPFAVRPQLLIIGASPVAQALSGLAQRTGFDVCAAFPGARADLFPDARRVVDGLDPAELGSDSPGFVVVATQGKRDEGGLELALASNAPYITFIASDRKAEKLRAFLKERDHDPARVDAILSPAGIDISAVTPEEIALSVLAGLVRARRSGKAIAASSATTCTQASAAALPSAQQQSVASTVTTGSAIDPVCGMSVDIASAEFFCEHQGSSYYFCCAGCQHGFEKAPEQYLAAAGAPA